MWPKPNLCVWDYCHIFIIAWTENILSLNNVWFEQQGPALPNSFGLKLFFQDICLSACFSFSFSLILDRMLKVARSFHSSIPRTYNLITELHSDHGFVIRLLLFFFTPLNPTWCVQLTGLCIWLPHRWLSTQMGFPKLLDPPQPWRAWLSLPAVMFTLIK